MRLGEIYAIPGGGKFAFGKVVYLSEYFKEVMLVRFFEKAYASPERAPDELDVLPSRAFFTGIDSIKKGGWKLVATSWVSEAEKTMSRRIVGGDVWVGDDHIGPASDEELRTLPQMDVYGHRLIEKKVARLPIAG